MDRKPIRCCPVCQPIVVALIVCVAIAGLVCGLIGWWYALFPVTQEVYTASGRLDTSPAGQLLAGASTALEMTLPNNLLEYVGKQYHVDCLSPFAHKVTIMLGPLVSTWDGVHNVATCTGGIGSGFNYQVITPSIIRIIDPRGITFT